MRGEKHLGVATELEELWSFMLKRIVPAKPRPRSILREHFGRHVGEQFLPRDVFVFGYTMQHSLLAISLAPHNYGEVLYWEWYWQYPWFVDSFRARVEQAGQAFKGGRRDLYDRPFDTEHVLGDALNSGTLVPVAPSFATFVAGLRAPEE
ncbi:MAG: hypothetical protein ACHREM_07400 [Polyangiales bacterium]